MTRSLFLLRIGLLGCLCCAGLADVCRAEDPKDILWFGNSFTNAVCCGSTRSVPNVVLDIALAAGHVAPRNRNASVDSMTMEWHRLNNTAVINSGITAGEKWENVVLQDYSTSPTHIGNLALHLTSTLGMYNLVKAHSPEVIPVLYETWARGPGHSVYLGARPDFPGGPVQMQQELREGYHFSTDNINAAAGADLVKLARAGEAWQDGGFPLNFYGSDIYHAQNRGTLLNALVLYGTIYDDVTTSDIDLSTVVTKLNLSAADGQLVAGLADGVLGSEPFGPGDYNEDGDVNQLDLEDWGGQFGQSEPEMGADGNGDGKVDGADMLAWQRIASREAAGAAAASVATPEPGGSWLLVVGAGVGFMVARDAGVGAFVSASAGPAMPSPAL